MDFEKHEKGSLLEKNKNLKEKVTFESSDHMTFSCAGEQVRDLAYPSEPSGRNLQGREFETKEPQGMQQSDLFKAEYVFIVDSDGEDESTCRKTEQSPSGGPGNVAARPKSLAISSSLTSDVVRPKVPGAKLKFSSLPETSHGMTPKPKQAPTTLPRAAGRETKYANLSSSSPTVCDRQLTKPGVIRPVPVKSKLLLKREEEVYEPNPFSKYLEDDRGLFSEQ